MTFILMHLLMTALLIFLGYCLGRADGAMVDARRKVGAGRTATLGHNDAFNRMEAQLHGKTPTLLNRRWLVSYDHKGKEQVTAIPDDAFVMSIPEILKALNDPGVLIETEVLFEFCIKALERLRSRTTYKGISK